REAEAAHAGGADYLLVGPVFPTATHPDRAPLGLARLQEIVGIGLPVIAIGGVSPERMPELMAGAAIHGVAAIRALWHAADPADAAGRHTARAAGIARARPACRGGGAQPHDRAAAAARSDHGRAGRRDRAGAFRGRGLSMTTAVETMQDTPFTIGGRSFHSRRMVGTGKYRDNDTMARAIDASGAEIVTVAVRRVDLDRTKEEGVLYHLDAKRYFLLANTAGCYTAEDAVRFAGEARVADG